MQVGTTKDQGLYNKPSAAVHPGVISRRDPITYIHRAGPVQSVMKCAFRAVYMSLMHGRETYLLHFVIYMIGPQTGSSCVQNSCNSNPHCHRYLPRCLRFFVFFSVRVTQLEIVL